jgi:hypothetical protein
MCGEAVSASPALSRATPTPATAAINVLATRSGQPPSPATQKHAQKAAFLNFDISITTQCSFMKFCVYQRPIT